MWVCRPPAFADVGSSKHWENTHLPYAGYQSSITAVRVLHTKLFLSVLKEQQRFTVKIAVVLLIFGTDLPVIPV